MMKPAMSLKRLKGEENNMSSEFVVVNDKVCERFATIEEAREFANQSANENKLRTSIYLQCGTQVGIVEVVEV